MISATIEQTMAEEFAAFQDVLPQNQQVRAWQSQVANYRTWWTWFTGEALRVQDPTAKTKDGSPAYYYPLHVNPIQWITAKHVSALFGEVPDEEDTLVKMSFLNQEGKVDDDTKKAEDILSTIWYESNGRDIMDTAASESQFLGGSFFVPRWEPWRSDLTYGIRFEHVSPDFILPIYQVGDMWNLLESHIMYRISPQEANERHGLSLPTSGGVPVLYHEKWTKDAYELKIKGEPAKIVRRGFTADAKGSNPYGFVPTVYIPHPPRVGSYYGIGHVDEIEGLVKEFNRRIADIGSAVQQVGEVVLAAKNITGKISMQRITDRLETMVLPSGGMTGKDPDIKDIRVSIGEAISASNTFLAHILDLIDRGAHLSSVSYGEDEGSQRSGVTLAARMYPLAAHVRRERMMWSTGLRQLNMMALRMIAAFPNSPQFKLAGINDEMLKLKPTVGWFSMLPLDRPTLVDEVNSRVQNGTISVRTGVEMLGNGGDVDEEIVRIDEDAQKKADREVEIAAASKPAPGSGFGQ